jgi:hypothetical protein
MGINGLDADAWLMERGVIGELPEPGTLTFCLGMEPPAWLPWRLPRHLVALRRALGGSPLPPVSAPPLPVYLLLCDTLACQKRKCTQDVKVYDVACRLLDDGIQGVREEISKLRKQLSLLGQQEALDAKLKAFSEESSLQLKKGLKDETTSLNEQLIKISQENQALQGQLAEALQLLRLTSLSC